MKPIVCVLSFTWSVFGIEQLGVGGIKVGVTGVEQTTCSTLIGSFSPTSVPYFHFSPVFSGSNRLPHSSAEVESE